MCLKSVFRAARVFHDSAPGKRSYICLEGKRCFFLTPDLTMPRSVEIDFDEETATDRPRMMALFADSGSDEDFEAAPVEHVAARALDAVDTVRKSAT